MTAADYETAEVAMFTSVTVKHSPGREVEVGSITISSPPAWIVYGGEYPEEAPDVLVEIHHAVDEDGGDIAEQVARRIAAALSESAP